MRATASSNGAMWPHHFWWIQQKTNPLRTTLLVAPLAVNQMDQDTQHHGPSHLDLLYQEAVTLDHHLMVFM
jgi:hypothetical protein